MTTEADTCRKYILPKLYAAGWIDDQISEQRTFTDGRIMVVGTKISRRPQKRADYLLRYRPNFTIAVVEAKSVFKNPYDGLQQAKEYAQILDLKFAYSTNGHGIIEFDFLTGRESDLELFPSPKELWGRLRTYLKLNQTDQQQRFLSPSLPVPDKPLRYYQEIAINRVIHTILKGRSRVLINMATGTGKTDVALHICWKLWNTRWNRTGEPRRPRILYLSDRSVLVDDPKDKQFAQFGDARWKIQGEAIKSREIYFATYQAIAKDERRPGLYREYNPDFFDLIIVDECHRGSARDESNWREILEYFHPAYQLGMTATPRREDNRDTYRYFGNPVYTYSLRQGIDDGFLAPYRVHRIITDVDATGWRPSKDELDRYGHPIPDEEYQTPDFERIVVLRARTSIKIRRLVEETQKYLAQSVMNSISTDGTDLELYTLLESLKHPDQSVSFRIALPNLKLLKDDKNIENEYDVVSVILKEDKHVEVWIWGVTTQIDINRKRTQDHAKIQKLKDLLGNRWGGEIRAVENYIHKDGNIIRCEIDGRQPTRTITT